MANQTINGKGFEFACLKSIIERYESRVKVVIEEDAAYLTARNAFTGLENEHKKILLDGASSGVKIIEKLEANLANTKHSDLLYVNIQKDSAGQTGDVRDLIISKNGNWEIGISAKHNHEAVKHSRLSPIINFGDKWLGCPCSSQYFEAINIVFNKLKPSIGKKWDEVALNKDVEIYRPLLIAFKDEVISLYSKHGSEVPTNLIKYLIGEHDFYKLILDVKKEIIKVSAYNLSNTLNKNAGSVRSAYNISKINAPTKIFHIDFLESSNNTLELICNNGWQISFRIHNASSRIENSMKFDVKLIGVPVDIPTFIGVL